MGQYIKKEFNNKRCIICLGEDARYDFAKELIDFPFKQQILKEEARNNTFYIYKTGELKKSNKDDEEVRCMTSSRLPYKSIVQIPGNNKISREAVGQKLNTKIYIFEQYPYGKDTTRMLLEECHMQYPWAEIKVLLWQEERRFGATDVSDEIVAIKMAQRRFNEVISDCTIIKNEVAFKELFYTQFQYTLQLGQEYETSIKNLKQDMASIFEDYYYFEVESLLEDELLTVHQLDRYCRYETIKNTEDMWQGFCNSFQKDALKQNGIIQQATYSLYKRMIEEICFWDIEEDTKTLKKEIDQCFYKLIVLKKPKTKVLKRPKSEMEYRIQMAKEPLDVMFKEKVQGFVKEDLKRCLKSYIETKVKEIER